MLGAEATKGDEQRELMKTYENAVAEYSKAVKDAQEEGLLPVLD